MPSDDDIISGSNRHDPADAANSRAGEGTAEPGTAPDVGRPNAGQAGVKVVERTTDAPVSVNLRRADTEVADADPTRRPTAATGTDGTIKGTPNESPDHKSGESLEDDA